MTVKQLRRLIRESVEEKGSFESARLGFTYTIDASGRRMFIDARLKSPDWLEKAMIDVHPERPAVEQTVDLDGDEAYLNRMDANFHGRGYGRETMQAVLRFLKSRGFKHARGYIEHGNTNSQNMMKKLGAVQGEYKEHGAYWDVDLGAFS